MWSRLTGKSDSGSSASNRDKDEEARRRRTSDSTRSKRDRDSDARSVVSSTSTRKPSRRDTAPSSIASFATAFDDVQQSRANDDLYEDPRDERYARRRDDRSNSFGASSVSTPRRDRSRSRDRDQKDSKKSRDKDKDRKREWRRSTRSERSGSLSQATGHRGDVVESPKVATRSFSGQIRTEGFSQFPGQAGAPMMSGALPAGSQPHPGPMSSHVQDQFPGQDPAQFASSALPGGNPFGAAADYYNDQGQSVDQQPGIRPQPPSVIIGQDTPHLVSASAQPNPVADTGAGAAADFYGSSTTAPSSSKPPRPSSSSMPGAFIDEGPSPQKPPRPSSKPDKSSKFGPAATVAGGAALGYAMGHSSSSSHQQSVHHTSSNNYHSTSQTNSSSAPSASTYSMYYQDHPSTTATNGSSHLPSYSAPHSGIHAGAMEDVPPPKPPRPGKSAKHSSGSNAGLYAAAGAAGVAAYGLQHHNSHTNTDHAAHNSHHHSASTPGAFPAQQHNGYGSSPNQYVAGGMAQRHQHTGPVSRFVDWWKDYEDVQKMEEYTEYIGVCKYCFDPRSSVMDAPRKHHYHKRRSNEYIRPSGGIEKHSRYSLKEKKSHSSFSSGDERRKKSNSSAAGWVAAGLGGIGLAKAGKAVFAGGRDDFDDTYSIKSGRETRSRISHRSRSNSRDRKSYKYGQSAIRHRSRSRDRMSQMSVGVTKDKKDYKIVRRNSRSSSSSSSRDGRSGFFGTAIGAGLAGAALGAVTKKKHRSRSRSRSPKKVYVQHQRRDSDERRRRMSQQLRRKSSRSSASGASVIEIGQEHQSQGGFLGGFFAAPPPKEKLYKSKSHQKKKSGFFTFGNGSSSSSDSEMAFGTGYVRRRRRSSPKRRNSDERLKASLAGLGATAAAIAAAKAGKKRHSEVVAVKQHRLGRNSIDRPRPGSRYGDDEWEDLPDDDTSDSSEDAGLVYGDYELKKTKSKESLASNGSGTNKWGWRWGFGKKKRRSSDNLYDNIASTSLIGPTAASAAGALTGAAIGSGIGRHDSESSSVHTLQTVYPVAPSDPTASFDARRTSSIQTPQPLLTSSPGAISIQQPQPMHQVPGTIYSTQAPSQPGYAASAGPPVFSQAPNQPWPTQFQTQNVIVQASQPTAHPPLPRRANSSPIQSSSWKRDAAIAGIAGTAGAVAISALKRHDQPDRPPSASSNVRFNLTQEQVDKEQRGRRKEQDRREEEDSRRREQQMRDEESRRAEEDRLRREQLVREEEARWAEAERRREQLRLEDQTREEEERRRREQLRLEAQAREEDERRRRELQRQQEEARKYMEAERLAKVEAERRLEAQRQHQQAMQARAAAEAEELERQKREARAELLRRQGLEAEAERTRKEQREAERVESARRDREMREDVERRRRDLEAQKFAAQYEVDSERRKLVQQPTGSSVSSVATDVRRKEQELQDRERDLVQPDPWKSTAAGAVAAGAAAAITSAAISSYQDKGKKKKDKQPEGRRNSSPRVKTAEPSKVKDIESSYKAYSPSQVKTVEPSNVVTFEPSKISQDYFDDEIFDPNMFKKKESVRDVYQDWEDRYSAKPVSQAEFFAPKELLENDSLPKVRSVDPNEGATDLHTYQAHDDFGPTVPIAPPYPPSYSFTASKDGRGSSQQPWSVPVLNLIQPTPPGSRAPSVRSVSLPPSPSIEPVTEKEEPKPEGPNRARSRVSWGENQFHHFEVATPDSYREQFMSESELKDHYRPEDSSRSEPKEIASSTQYIRDDNDSSWDSIVGAASKKSSKKEKKKAAAAAAALTTEALRSRDEEIEQEYKRDTRSVISNPFSDTHAAPPSTIAASTVISSAPSEATVLYSPQTPSSTNQDRRERPEQASKGQDFVEKELPTESTSSRHMPGSFDETPVEEKPVEEVWAMPSKEKKGKKKSKNTDESVVTNDLPKPVRPDPEPVLEQVKQPEPELESKSNKKEKKRKSKAAKRASVDSWEESDISPLTSPTVERDIRDIEPSRPADRPHDITFMKDAPPPSNSTSSNGKASTAAMAGGFAALVGAAMTQDQARMASDLERARQSLESAEQHLTRDTPSSPPNGTRALDENEKSIAIPSTAFQDVDELADAKTPKGKSKRHSSGKWSPTIGSPLRTEMRHEDYMSSRNRSDLSNQQPLVEAPKIPTASAFSTVPQSSTSRNTHDSGHYAPDDVLLRKEPADRDSDEFYSAGSDEKEKAKAQAPGVNTEDDHESRLRHKYEDDEIRSRERYDDDDVKSVISSSSKFEDPDREERRRRRREAKSESRERSRSRDRDYGFEADGERRRKHRRRETEEPTDDWDTRSTISEPRSEANGERRRKHRRRESERDGSVESKTRSRSSAASEPGDLYDDRKSPKRRSKRDGDDDNASVISSSSRYDEERSPKKERKEEKRSSGLFGLFSKSKENLAETSSKSSKSKDDDEEEDRKHRRRKHRSDRGSTYGSDDDDARSTISTSSRREKRSSRSERGEGERKDPYDDKVHRSSYAR